ncbi:MAG: DUF4139 domain-containing protein [Candidatus Brocadiia bacterium]
MWKKLVTLVITLGVMSGMVTAQEEKKENDAPPVTKIVLYKHGMGYFERLALVKDNGVISLSFKTSQMPDLLTSFFAVDLSGKGSITSIGYDSKDPIDKQLENILIRVPEGAALTQFLSQLKGAKVEVKIGSETARGSILGIEPVSQKMDNTVITSYKLILLRDDGAIQPFSLFDISTMRLLDEPIQKDLQRILDIYLHSKYTDRKVVKLETTGKGNRDILMGYLLEMPIWKTSYRLLLGENKQPYLQGWAIVENPTDEDWDNVQMSFVSGNPISFKLDLYTSFYPPRPIIDLNAIATASDKLNLEALSKSEMADSNNWEAEGDARMNDKAKGNRAYAAPMAPGMITGGGYGKNKQPLNELMASSVKSVATGIKVGEMFSYNSQTPVSIKRRQSAMIPIVTEMVDGKKVLYYRAAISPRAMNALYLTNSSKLTLETGPLTFFEESTSVGEGLLKQSLEPGMKEIIPYAMETTCIIEPVVKQDTKPVHKVSYANGTMVLRQFYINETNYKCINKSNKAFVFYLDHPRTGNYALMEPIKPEEEIPGYYRFKLELGANKTIDFKVVEQFEGASSISLSNTRLDQVSFYIGQNYLSKKMKEFLGEIKVLMEAISKQNNIFNEANQESQRLNEDQSRYRNNMNSLNINDPKEREVRASYVEKLQQVESKITDLRSLMLDSQNQRKGLEVQLAKKIQEFTEE